MSWFARLRLLAYAVRMDALLQRIATAQETLARIESERHARDEAARALPVRPPARVEFGLLDIGAANERYHREQEGTLDDDEA